MLTICETHIDASGNLTVSVKLITLFLASKRISYYVSLIFLCRISNPLAAYVITTTSVYGIEYPIPLLFYLKI